METELVLGIDIGGTNMRFGLVDRECGLRSFSIVSSQEVLAGGDVMGKLVECVEGYCDKHLGGRRPAAVSMGFPSTIDRTRRIVTSTPNIKGMDNLHVADRMEERLGIPAFVNRDVNFLFLYDLYASGRDASGTVLGFYIGTGFGNAVSVGGRLMLGKNGVAAELGHIPVIGGEANGPCGCGNPACVELYACGRALERLQAEQFPDTPIKQMFVRHLDDPRIQTYIEHLSIPVATEVNIFDPDYIIIGGGIPQMPAFPTAVLESYIHRHTRKPYPDQNLEICYSIPKQENGVIGAGIYAYKRLDDPDYR